MTITIPYNRLSTDDQNFLIKIIKRYNAGRSTLIPWYSFIVDIFRFSPRPYDDLQIGGYAEGQFGLFGLYLELTEEGRIEAMRSGFASLKSNE